jgi:YggT family protein
MLGAAVVGGIVVISLAGWIAAELGRVAFAARGGPFSSVRLLIYYTGQLISLAIFIRVIGSWFGVGPHSAWMRPMYVLTDWIIVPLRRVIPPIGMIDITPIVAWFGVRILTSILTGF